MALEPGTVVWFPIESVSDRYRDLLKHPDSTYLQGEIVAIAAGTEAASGSGFVRVHARNYRSALLAGAGIEVKSACLWQQGEMDSLPPLRPNIPYQGGMELLACGLARDPSVYYLGQHCTEHTFHGAAPYYANIYVLPFGEVVERCEVMSCYRLAGNAATGQQELYPNRQPLQEQLQQRMNPQWMMGRMGPRGVVRQSDGLFRGVAYGVGIDGEDVHVGTYANPTNAAAAVHMVEHALDLTGQLAGRGRNVNYESFELMEQAIKQQPLCSRLAPTQPKLNVINALGAYMAGVLYNLKKPLQHQLQQVDEREVQLRQQQQSRQQLRAQLLELQQQRQDLRARMERLPQVVPGMAADDLDNALQQRVQDLQAYCALASPAKHATDPGAAGPSSPRSGAHSGAAQLGGDRSSRGRLHSHSRNRSISPEPHSRSRSPSRSRSRSRSPLSGSHGTSSTPGSSDSEGFGAGGAHYTRQYHHTSMLASPSASSSMVTHGQHSPVAVRMMMRAALRQGQSGSGGSGGGAGRSGRGSGTGRGSRDVSPSSSVGSMGFGAMTVSAAVSGVGGAVAQLPASSAVRQEGKRQAGQHASRAGEGDAAVSDVNAGGDQHDEHTAMAAQAAAPGAVAAPAAAGSLAGHDQQSPKAADRTAAQQAGPPSRRYRGWQSD